jgi:hypothetical protein
MEYTKEKSPLVYGIMFSEREGSQVETVWYESAEERDEAINYILEHGEIEIKSHLSRLVRSAKVKAFSKVDAEEHFYRLKESYQD